MTDDLHRFYVYVLFRADGRPCYVGKGSGKRTKDHFRMGKSHYNSHLANIFAKHEREGLSVREEIIAKFLTEAEAFELEKVLIAQHGRADLGTGCLANLTDGGEGAIIALEARQKIVAAHKGVKNPAKGRKGRVISKATREKIAAVRRGKKRSPETCAKMSAYWTSRGSRPECGRRGVENASFGKKRSEEARALMSAKAKEVWARRRAARTA